MSIIKRIKNLWHISQFDFNDKTRPILPFNGSMVSKFGYTSVDKITLTQRPATIVEDEEPVIFEDELKNEND